MGENEKREEEEKMEEKETTSCALPLTFSFLLLLLLLLILSLSFLSSGKGSTWEGKTNKRNPKTTKKTAENSTIPLSNRLTFSCSVA